MTERPNPEPHWYPDPFGRHELRYWDGAEWTHHVSSHGRQSTDTPAGEANMPVGTQSREQVRRQVEQHLDVATRHGAARSVELEGDGSIFGEPILVVNQKARLIEVHNEYAIYDRNGLQLGAVRQVGQSGAKKALRVFGSMDQFFTHKLQVVDMGGNVLMQITRPAKLVKSRVLVQDGRGNDIGEVVQENVLGKIRFAYTVAGQRIGGIKAENWRAWNFSLVDHSETEVARITKTFEGVATTLFTTADNYVLQIHEPLEEPLRSLVVASALTIDTALKQDNRGVN